ncbi:unnamed protein product [Closterium sp. NIES-54]
MSYPMARLSVGLFVAAILACACTTVSGGEREIETLNSEVRLASEAPRYYEERLTVASVDLIARRKLKSHKKSKKDKSKNKSSKSDKSSKKSSKSSSKSDKTSKSSKSSDKSSSGSGKAVKNCKKCRLGIAEAPGSGKRAAGVWTTNPVDNCWWSADWKTNRQELGNCAPGFANGTTGGKGGKLYVVTTEADDPVNPTEGMLRYGIIQKEPLWIVFERDMVFDKLKAEMMIASDKTIDARGRAVVIQNGPCARIERSSNVIVESVIFHNCTMRSGTIKVRSGRGVEVKDWRDGNAVEVWGSTNVWIDHCGFEMALDTQVNIVVGSTNVAVTNNYFVNQDEVMLMGNDDAATTDDNMRVTVGLNVFGPNCNQRMPRGRHGQFHVVNNYYPNGWGIYAIGGSANARFRSEANYFVAGDIKEVTKRQDTHGWEAKQISDKTWTKIHVSSVGWQNWPWQSIGDHFENGAFFTESGKNVFTPPYEFNPVPAMEVPAATNRAGPLFRRYQKQL